MGVSNWWFLARPQVSRVCFPPVKGVLPQENSSRQEEKLLVTRRPPQARP